MTKVKKGPIPFNIALGEGVVLSVGYTKDSITLETAPNNRVQFSFSVTRKIAKTLKQLADAVEKNEKTQTS